MVKFRDSSERYDTPSALQRIDSEVRNSCLASILLCVKYESKGVIVL